MKQLLTNIWGLHHLPFELCLADNINDWSWKVEKFPVLENVSQASAVTIFIESED